MDRNSERDKMAKILATICSSSGSSEVDKVFFEAKLIAEKRLVISNLFDVWIELLLSRGCPTNSVLGFLTHPRPWFIERALHIWSEKYPDDTIENLVQKGIYPIVPVISLYNLGISGLMGMVEKNGVRGCSNVDEQKIFRGKLLSGSSFIFDVSARLVEHNQGGLEKGQRLLTVEEGISFCIFCGLPFNDFALTSDDDQVDHFIYCDGETPILTRMDYTVIRGNFDRSKSLIVSCSTQCSIP